MLSPELITFVSQKPKASPQYYRLNDHFTAQLPADSNLENYTRQVSSAAYSYVLPATVNKPQLIAYSADVANLLGLPNDYLDSDEFAEVMTGNKIVEGSCPYAMAYGGHQFGNWAGQLGDGRAINLMQVDVDNGQNFTLQLKGSGETPYSRSADGLAVLRSSVREFLCSEAMYHLGIPTTRALSLCLSGESVVRDMFYDGHPQEELGAIVCRVSQSFMRIGSIELPASRGDLALTQQLVDYHIQHYYSHLGEPSKATYLAWFDEICDRTCRLIVDWMRVGFVHGVMNTDNMSLLGETIDYGPYGWIDNFDLNWTPNTTDAKGKRYCFGAQPEIGQWNLFQLANAIYPLIDDAEPLKASLNKYAANYQQQWLVMMAQKLGIEVLDSQEDTALFIQLEQVMSEEPTDMTIFYRLLATLPQEQSLWHSHLLPCFYGDMPEESETWQHWHKWLTHYFDRINKNEIDNEERTLRMNAVNPCFVLRNYLSQQAIEKAEAGDFSMIEELLTALRHPYQEEKIAEHLRAKRPDWALNKAGCSMLSCSS
ncbi:protein adenylyltransferase SelO [Thalassotalea fusca]